MRRTSREVRGPWWAWEVGCLMQARALHPALAVTSDPLRQRGTGDTGLGGYMGDRTTGAWTRITSR